MHETKSNESTHETQTNNDQKLFEFNQPQSHFDMPTGLQSQITPLNRLSEQEEEDDDGDYDDDIEEGCEDDVMENVSKNPTSSNFTCYSGRADSKLNAYSSATDTTITRTDSLRRRNVATNAKNAKSKCVQFMPSHNVNDVNDVNDNSLRPNIYSSSEMNMHSRPLKKIVFNGTFPIDDPYSSRF